MASGKVTVWDLPLRIWHWLFGGAVLTALATGLIEEFDSIIVHQWAGISVVCLLVFRLTWGFWGGVYARWSKYSTTPRKILLHFLRRGQLTPHTAPGIVLALVLMLAALAQSVSGLFMTDDIFFDGPLFRYIDDATADTLSGIHHNAWRVVLGAVGLHLVAHLIYGLVLRDSTPLSMITGKKDVTLAPASNSWYGAALSVVIASVVFLGLAVLAD